MNEGKTRILEQWEAAPQQPQGARILAEVDAAAVQALQQMPVVEPEDGLELTPGSPWPRRLMALLLGLVGIAAGAEWLQLTLAAWQWQPLAGVALATAGGGVLAAGGLAWRDLRRQRLRISDLEQLRGEMRQALEDPARRLALDWLDRLQGVYRGTPRAAELATAISGLDASHSAEEVARRLNQQFYQPLDSRARQLIRRESSSTGLLVATSPWITLDLLLVLWRNLRMMQKVAQIYGLPAGQLSRWRLARQVLRNIALAGGTELAIGALSESLLSGLFEKLAARVGQGMGVGLYSARLGHFTLDLCRAVPLPDRSGFAEDNQGILQSIRQRLGGGERSA